MSSGTDRRWTNLHAFLKGMDQEFRNGQLFQNYSGDGAEITHAILSEMDRLEELDNWPSHDQKI